MEGVSKPVSTKDRFSNIAAKDGSLDMLCAYETLARLDVPSTCEKGRCDDCSRPDYLVRAYKLPVTNCKTCCRLPNIINPKELELMMDKVRKSHPNFVEELEGRIKASGEKKLAHPSTPGYHMALKLYNIPDYANIVHHSWTSPIKQTEDGYALPRWGECYRKCNVEAMKLWLGNIWKWACHSAAYWIITGERAPSLISSATLTKIISEHQPSNTTEALQTLENIGALCASLRHLSIDLRASSDEAGILMALICAETGQYLAEYINLLRAGELGEGMLAHLKAVREKIESLKEAWQGIIPSSRTIPTRATMGARSCKIYNLIGILGCWLNMADVAPYNHTANPEMKDISRPNILADPRKNTKRFKAADKDYFTKRCPIDFYNGHHQIYICGSLQNITAIRLFADKLKAFFHFYTEATCDVLDPWTSHGSEPDKEYTNYSLKEGWSYTKAIREPVVEAIFKADVEYINRCNVIICFGPAGKSAYSEMGYARGLSEAAEKEGKSPKVVLFIKGLKDSATYEGIDCMEHFAHAIWGTEGEFWREIIYCNLDNDLWVFGSLNTHENAPTGPRVVESVGK